MVERHRYSLWTKGKRIIRYGYCRLIRLQSTPSQMARGLGVGVFAGSFPFFGFQTLIGVTLAVPFRGNPMMAALGTWISNPLTYVPLFVFNFKLGCWILRLEDMGLNLSTIKSLEAWQEWGMSSIAAFMAGCVVTGVTLGVLSYWGSLVWFRRQKQQRLQRLRSQVRSDQGTTPVSRVG
ncbi:MAG: DUF2062 domain-containing protein [Prochlorothrix sp.]